MENVVKPYSQWHFFDKNGDYYNFEYDENAGKWTGEIYFPEVSTGLIENQHLFIVEKASVNADRDLYFPKNIIGLEPGFARFSFTLTLSPTYDENSTFVWKDCANNVYVWKRIDYPNDDSFLSAIENTIKSIPGYQNTYRVGATFNVILELAQQPCIDYTDTSVGVSLC